MSTERPSFGLNSILPSGYMNKAEAFAKCLQDKLRSLGSCEEPVPGQNVRGLTEESPKTPHGSLTKFSEEEIADNVFLQGPLSYKRRSIPEHGAKPHTNGIQRGKYLGSLVDKRGMSSDSDDSESEDLAASSLHRRVTELQGGAGHPTARRLASVNSVDSTSSWCSCDEGPAADDDEEVIDTFAAQIKGSPPIHNPRMRNLKRRSREEKVRIDRQPPPPPPDADLFFDFDVECFSPVNLEEDLEPAFETTRLRLMEEDRNPWESDFPDTGQILGRKDVCLSEEPTETDQAVVKPPPSPVNGKSAESQEIQMTKDSNDNVEPKEIVSIAEPAVTAAGHDVDSTSVIENDSSSSHQLIVKQSVEADIESSPEAQWEDKVNASREIESPDSMCNIGSEIKDSGICSCEETSSRTGDEDISEIAENLNIGEEENALSGTDQDVESLATEATESLKIDAGEASPAMGATEVTSPIMVLCDGVEIDESYLPSPRMKLRRCSSLKTWKTPPGTPGRKKIVRFADALGLDLADVRMFLDEVPKIPNSAFEDLHYDLPPVWTPPPATERTLIPMFQQPGTQMDFLQRVRTNNVSLESAVLTDVSLLSICGVVRVRNLSFHKTVHVRYSKDSWTTFSDLQATFVPNSSDGFCDNFSFTLYGHTLSIGDRLEFAIRYDCAAGQFWDSNGGANYAFQCMPRCSMPLFPPLGSSPVDTWNKFY